MSGINVDTIGLASSGGGGGNGTGIANNKSLPQSPASMVSSESETQSISDEQTPSTVRRVSSSLLSLNFGTHDSIDLLG